MLRFCRGLSVHRIALFSFFETQYDEVKTPGYEELQDQPSGLKAIRKLFTANEYGEMCPEFITMTHMSFCCILGGAILGGVIQSKQSWLNFMENNQATAFVSQFDAQRKLQDTIIISMGKGAWKWGWKIGAFSTIFILANTVIAAYRGGPGFFEYVGAGALTGALFKINLGLKGMIAGTVAGTFFGAVGGSISMLLFTITGFTMKDIQNTQNELKKFHDKYYRLAHAKLSNEKNEPLIRAAMIEEQKKREASESAKTSYSLIPTIENEK